MWIEICFGCLAYHLPTSQPARAVWIEIPVSIPFSKRWLGHSLRGLCGLKFNMAKTCVDYVRHSLRGLCGLKFPDDIDNAGKASHSLRGLCGLKCSLQYFSISSAICHSLRGLCGLKYPVVSSNRSRFQSQPARAVWIEICETSV